MTANRLLPKANALNKLLNSDSASYKHTVPIYETCWHYYTHKKHRGKLCTFIRKNISTIKKNRDASIHLMHRSLHLMWASWDFSGGGKSGLTSFASACYFSPWIPRFWTDYDMHCLGRKELDMYQTNTKIQVHRHTFPFMFCPNCLPSHLVLQRMASCNFLLYEGHP